MPKGWHESDLYCQLIPNDDENNDVYDVVPRLYAFEVSTVNKGMGILLYSKLATSIWPLCSSLGKKIGRYNDAIKDGNAKLEDVTREFMFDPRAVSRQKRARNPMNSTGYSSFSNTISDSTLARAKEAPAQKESKVTANAEEKKTEPAPAEVAKEEPPKEETKAEPQPEAPAE